MQEFRLVEPDYFALIVASTIDPLLFVAADSSLPRINHDVDALAKFTRVTSVSSFSLAQTAHTG